MIKKSEQPKAVGYPLTEEQIEKVARTVYDRFHYTYGLRPSWVDNENVRKIMREQVKTVLDALRINKHEVL